MHYKNYNDLKAIRKILIGLWLFKKCMTLHFDYNHITCNEAYLLTVHYTV